MTGNRYGGNAAGNPRRGWVIIALVLLVGFGGGAIMLMRGLEQRSAAAPLAGGMRTTGTVVAVSKSCFKGCTYRPTISYVVEQHTYTFVGVVHAYRPAIGSSDPISYDPSDPAIAHDLGGSEGAWIGSVVIGALGIGVAAALLVLVLWARRRYGRSRAQGLPDQV